MGPDAIDLPRPFGPYTLVRRLAVGGMAEVYVAKAQGIGGFEKLVAIKVIHPRYSEDEHFVRMLIEEAKISVLLTHVNVAQVYDLGCIEDTYYIVMEYIEGVDAHRLLRRASEQAYKLPLEMCAHIGAEMCHGLGYAHRKTDAEGRSLGIVHRDISPQNVLLSFAGEVKIVDFGIAKAALRTAQTDAGVIKGKYYYMSPEQAWGDAMDHRSDIFSTGIVLYELLTGQMLYDEDNLPQLLDRIRKAEVVAPSTKRPDIPKELDDIVLRALAKRPEDRWQSADDFSQALTQFLYGHAPTFAGSRLAEILTQLFEDEYRERPTGVHRLPTGEAPTELADSRGASESSGSAAPDRRMKRQEFEPNPDSVIYDLADHRQAVTRGAGASSEKHAPQEASESGELEGGATRVEGRGQEQGEPDPPREQVQPRGAAGSAFVDDGDDWDDESTMVSSGELGVVKPQLPAREDDRDDGEWEEETLVDQDGQMASQLREAMARGGGPEGQESAAERTSPHTRRDGQGSQRASGQPDPAEGPSGQAPDRAAAPPKQSGRDESRSRSGRSAPPPPSKASRSVPPPPPPSKASRSTSSQPPASRTSGSAPPPPPPSSGSAPPSKSSGSAPSQPPASEASSRAPQAGAAGASSPGSAAAPGPQAGVQGPSSSAPPPPWPSPAPAPDPGSAAAGPGADNTGAYMAMMREHRRQRFARWAFGTAVATAVVLAALAVFGLWALFADQGPPAPQVEVVSDPKGARVKIDGELQPGKTPLRVQTELKPGHKYRLQVMHPGYETWSTTFEARAGRLKQIAALSPLRTDLTVITEPPESLVWVNGTERGKAPVTVSDVAIGSKVELRAEREGYHDASKTVTLEAEGDEPQIELELQKRK